MLGRRFNTMAMAAALMGLGAIAPGFAQPAPIVTENIPAKRKKGLFNRAAAPVFVRTYGYPRKDRMNTAAQHKRASKKAHGVAKHRRHA
ncbi:MAG: hypothetical protein ACXU8N_18280 [Telluria sp.]